MSKVIPFPQADSLEKVIRIAKIDDESYLKNNNIISSLLGNITTRQVNYYLSAAEYLGLINNRSFTKEGMEYRSLYGNDQKVYLAYLLFRMPVFGQALANNVDLTGFMKILKEFYPNMNDRMIKRRSQSGLAWIKYFNFKIIPAVSDGLLLSSKLASLAFFSEIIYGFETTEEDIEEMSKRYDCHQDSHNAWVEYKKLIDNSVKI